MHPQHPDAGPPRAHGPPATLEAIAAGVGDDGGVAGAAPLPTCGQVCKLPEVNKRLTDALTALKRAQRLLIQSERQHAMGQVASRLMHDFNNALMPILGFTELLMQEEALWSRREEMLSILTQIRNATQRAAAEVYVLRRFCHADGKPETGPVDLNQLVQESLAETRVRWQRDGVAGEPAIDVRLQLAPLPPVGADAAALRDAIGHLLDNAREAMPHGGVIAIATREASREITLEVQDSGMGMPEPTLSRCAEPFFSTKGEHAAGIGLSVVHGVAAAHDGRVRIVSRVGEGTRVVLTLPWTPEPAPVPGAAAPPVPVPEPAARRRHPEAARPPIHILYVEDDAAVRCAVATHLTHRHHVVTTAANGREALLVLEHTVADLVITDLAMPEMAGDEFVRRLRLAGNRVPVLLLTGFGDAQAVDGFAGLDVRRVLTKPVTNEDLDGAIAEAVA